MAQLAVRPWLPFSHSATLDFRELHPIGAKEPARGTNISGAEHGQGLSASKNVVRRRQDGELRSDHRTHETLKRSNAASTTVVFPPKSDSSALRIIPRLRPDCGRHVPYLAIDAEMFVPAREPELPEAGFATLDGRPIGPLRNRNAFGETPARVSSRSDSCGLGRDPLAAKPPASAGCSPSY